LLAIKSTTAAIRAIQTTDAPTPAPIATALLLLPWLADVPFDALLVEDDEEEVGAVVMVGLAVGLGVGMGVGTRAEETWSPDHPMMQLYSAFVHSILRVGYSTPLVLGLQKGEVPANLFALVPE
jgi:hypothetical protein